MVQTANWKEAKRRCGETFSKHLKWSQGEIRVAWTRVVTVETQGV